MVKKPPVGAHYGLRDWIAQRATAAILVVAIATIGGALLICAPSGYDEWRAFVGAEWVRILLFLSVLAVAWHAFIGARDILMDYIKHDAFRLFKTVGCIVYLLACVVWAARILL